MSGGQYWIRNRGRIRGPFTPDRLQALARRGRFSRVHEVSMDKEEWHRAADFPELFEGGMAPMGDGLFDRGTAPAQHRHPDDDFDDGPDRDGLDDDRASDRPTDEDDFDDDDDWDDEDFEDLTWREQLAELDVDWPKAIAGTLAVALLGYVFGFYLPAKWDWAADRDTYEQLVAVYEELEAQRARGPGGDGLFDFGKELTGRLEPTVEKLLDKASAQDRLKQQLLFAARDDVPRALDHMAEGKGNGLERMAERLNHIAEMLERGNRMLPDRR